MIVLKNLYFIFYSFLFSLTAILFALYYEYIENYPPCELCIYQRFPYYLIIVTTLFFFVFKKNFNIVSSLIILAVFISLLLSVTHAGVELGWWQIKSSCSNNIRDFNDIEKLRSFLEDVPITKCDQIIWSYKGISMAGYNVTFSIVNLIILTTYKTKLK